MDIHSIFMRYSLYRFRYSVEYWFHKKKNNKDGYCLQPHVERIIAGPKDTMAFLKHLLLIGKARISWLNHESMFFVCFKSCYLYG